MKKNSEFGCQRCDSYSAGDVTLFGDVATRICADCRNAFRDVAEGLPEWTEMEDLNLRVQAIGLAAQGVRDCYEEIRPMLDRLKAIRLVIRAVGEKWLMEEPETVGAVARPDGVSNV